MMLTRPRLVALPSSRRVFLAMPDDRPFAERLAAAAGAAAMPVHTHVFPDGETLLRLVDGSVSGADVAIVAGLRDPDRHTLTALLLADAARQWGAARVGLVAPYLPYLRQDAVLHEGDAVTSRSFARILSQSFDWLVTIDPHLHRVRRLSQIYTIPARAVQSAPALGAWIDANVSSPLVVGPDAESRQWAERVASAAGAPFIILEKTRRGDADVTIRLPPVHAHAGRTPVLVDDIISSGATMAAAIRLLRTEGFAAPVCLGVHALFGSGAVAALEHAGARLVATTNTIPHGTNQIDVAPLLAAALTRPAARLAASR